MLEVQLDDELWSDAGSRLLSAILSEKAIGFATALALPTIYDVMVENPFSEATKGSARANHVLGAGGLCAEPRPMF